MHVGGFLEIQAGQRVGDYEILNVIGSGGMGTVYRVQNVISRRIEALKVLLPDLASEPDLAARFMGEIRTLAGFDHPNIAQLRTAVENGNRLLMIMEFVEGCTLEARAKAERLELTSTLGYIGQVLTALAYAHSKGVVHRDIKPANVMITPQNVVKLMDFGIAKSAGTNDLTQTGTTIGSLSYMAPEQVHGRAVDARSDIYSTGVMLYELATGAKPFQAENAFALLELKLKTDPKPPCELNPFIPAALGEIILTSLARDPARRFQNAEAFKNALQSVSGSEPTLAPSPRNSRPAVAVEPTSRTGGRRMLWAGAGALVFATVLSLAAFVLPRWTRTRASSSIPPVAEGRVRRDTLQANPPPLSPLSSPASRLPIEEVPDSAPRAITKRVVAEHLRMQPEHITEAARDPVPEQRVKPDEQRSLITEQLPAARETAEHAGPMRERLIQLGTRSAAVKESVERLRADQAAAGYGLRQDISASLSRMEAYFDAAVRASEAGDLVEAARQTDKAEKELETLETFTGR
jgi:serine/threonine-protein kinase